MNLVQNNTKHCKNLDVLQIKIGNKPDSEIGIWPLYICIVRALVTIDCQSSVIFKCCEMLMCVIFPGILDMAPELLMSVTFHFLPLGASVLLSGFVKVKINFRTHLPHYKEFNLMLES